MIARVQSPSARKVPLVVTSINLQNYSFFFGGKISRAGGMTLSDSFAHVHDLGHDSSPSKVNSRGIPWFDYTIHLLFEMCVMICRARSENTIVAF